MHTFLKAIMLSLLMTVSFLFPALLEDAQAGNLTIKKSTVLPVQQLKRTSPIAGIHFKCYQQPTLCQNKPCLTGKCEVSPVNENGCQKKQAGVTCQEPLPGGGLGAYETGTCSVQGLCETPSQLLPDLVPTVGTMASVSQGICHPGTVLSIPVTIENKGAKEPALVGKQVTVVLTPDIQGGTWPISQSCRDALKKTENVTLTFAVAEGLSKTYDINLPLNATCLQSGFLSPNASIDVKVMITLTPQGFTESNASNNSLPQWTKVGSCKWQM